MINVSWKRHRLNHWLSRLFIAAAIAVAGVVIVVAVVAVVFVVVEGRLRLNI